MDRYFPLASQHCAAPSAAVPASPSLAHQNGAAGVAERTAFLRRNHLLAELLHGLNGAVELLLQHTGPLSERVVLGGIGGGVEEGGPLFDPVHVLRQAQRLHLPLAKVGLSM